MLNAFYDFAVSPCKYDFVGFLLDAERYRQMTGQDGIHFIFVPGPNDGFRQDILPPQNTDLRRGMLFNVLIPMCKMLPVPIKVTLCGDRDAAQECLTGEIFPSEYTVKVPAMHYGTQLITRAFQRGFYPFVAPLKMQPKPDLITITLRESAYWPTRNSDRETWLAAAQMIKDAGLRVLIIPDSDSPPIEGWKVDKEASTNLLRRVAIYEAAAHNLFVNNGPTWVAAGMEKVNGTLFKVNSPQAPCCNARFFKLIGFPPGSQIGRDNFKIVWKNDTKAVVLPEVRRIIKGIK